MVLYSFLNSCLATERVALYVPLANKLMELQRHDMCVRLDTFAGEQRVVFLPLLRIFFSFVLFLLFVSSSLLAQSYKQNSLYKEYIRIYADECIEQMKKHKIPASITMAQGLLESGAGRSRLATQGNNHFGIKCHKAWQGERMYADDDLPNECFRKYAKVKDSFTDHSIFLKQPRYQRLFTYKLTDYKSWAKGLQACGYATNKGYANALIGVIESYQLYELDREKYPEWMTNQKRRTSASSKKKDKEITLTHEGYISYGLVYVLANDGDTFTSIAEELDMKPDRLADYNDAPVDFPLTKGDVVFIERKNKRATPDYEQHIVQVGDSMHSISQLYGVRVSSLYKFNHLPDDYTPQEGDVLLLR